MAVSVKELREWLATLDDAALVGVDDSGLALEVVDSGAHLEIGGMPE